MLFKGGAPRALAAEDVRMGRHENIRPGTRQMLFKGGSVNRAKAVDDLRLGRHENIRPGTKQMLFKGGSAHRALATEDLRLGRHEDIEPGTYEMLYEGGEADEYEEDGEVSDELIMLAEDLCDAFSGYGMGLRSSDDDSKVEAAIKDAGHRAKGKIIAQILKAFIDATGG